MYKYSTQLIVYIASALSLKAVYDDHIDWLKAQKRRSDYQLFKSATLMPDIDDGAELGVATHTDPTYPILARDNTPTNMTFNEIMLSQQRFVVSKNRHFYGISYEEALEGAQNGWLELYKKLLQNPNYLQGKPLSWASKFVTFRALPRRERTHRAKTIQCDDTGMEIQTRRHAHHKPTTTHANFEEQVDFNIDFERAALMLARQFQDNTYWTWIIYLIITGRQSTNQHTRKSNGCYVNWCPSTLAAIHTLFNRDPSSVRKDRKRMQRIIQEAMPGWG